MKSHTHLHTAALAFAGVGVWYLAGQALDDAGHFENRPNPLGIKCSPYGQVLAMAIQTPIDGDWHGGLEIHDHAPGESCDSCDEGHAVARHDDPPNCGHDSHDPEGCGSEHPAHGECDHDLESEDPPQPASRGSLLARLDRAVTQRTNPNPPTSGHQLYLRREIEKKLRFAYELDPSHYANYNSYNLFIVQSALRTGKLTQEEADQQVFHLAERTLRYGLQESVDPRPALTAASAAYNALERMLLADSGTYSNHELRTQLELMDRCIQRHGELLEASLENGQWELLSGQRQQETLDRAAFTMHLREAAEKAIRRRESAQQANFSLQES